MQSDTKARLAVDIGGTFTDVAVALPGGPGEYVTAKCLTTPDDPVEGAMSGVHTALERAGLGPGDIGSFIHGTTLATNALIEPAPSIHFPGTSGPVDSANGLPGVS